MIGRNPPSNVHLFPKRKTQPWKVIYPTSWQDIEPDPVKWLVRNCIPRGTVCLFSGDSGLGKSLLMQQLQSCTALGKPWLGNEVERVRSFGFYCEDPENVLQLRQRDICQSLEAEQLDLEDMAIASRVGLDNVLMDFNRRSDEGRTTSLFDQLRDYIREFGAELVVIDTASHTFNGNENIRAHVTAFVTVLQEIATEINGAVVLCSHPSVSSMQSGTGYSGSTAWRATVRAHMYLKRPKGYDDEDEDADHNIRVLKTMKANWGPGVGLIKLRWDGGVFQPMAPDLKPVRGLFARIEIDNAIVQAISYVTKSGDRIAAGRQANNNIVKVISRLPSCRSFSAKDIFDSVDRLLENQKICRVSAGRAGKIAILLRTTEFRYPDEVSTDV